MRVVISIRWQSNVVRHAGTVALLKPNPLST
jgi:hypothetical protein